MKTSDLSTGPARLHKAMENLLLRWDSTKLVWHDQVSRQFEETYLSTFTSQIQSTLDRMRTLSSVFIAAEQDCNR